MEKAAIERYVEDRYKVQMNYYKTTAAQNQKKYKRVQWVLIILSALIPVFAALRVIKIGLANNEVTIDLNNLVLIMSCTVAILTAGLKTFDYQELWISYRTTYEKLKPEIYYYNFGIGPYGGEIINKDSIFVTRIEAILTSEHSNWPPLVKAETKNNDKSSEHTLAKNNVTTDVHDDACSP